MDAYQIKVFMDAIVGGIGVQIVTIAKALHPNPYLATIPLNVADHVARLTVAHPLLQSLMKGFAPERILFCQSGPLVERLSVVKVTSRSASQSTPPWHCRGNRIRITSPASGPPATPDAIRTTIFKSYGRGVAVFPCCIARPYTTHPEVEDRREPRHERCRSGCA